MRPMDPRLSHRRAGESRRRLGASAFALRLLAGFAVLAMLVGRAASGSRSRAWAPCASRTCPAGATVTFDDMQTTSGFPDDFEGAEATWSPPLILYRHPGTYDVSGDRAGLCGARGPRRRSSPSDGRAGRRPRGATDTASAVASRPSGPLHVGGMHLTFICRRTNSRSSASSSIRPAEPVPSGRLSTGSTADSGPTGDSRSDRRICRSGRVSSALIVSPRRWRRRRLAARARPRSPAAPADQTPPAAAGSPRSPRRRTATSNRDGPEPSMSAAIGRGAPTPVSCRSKSGRTPAPDTPPAGAHAAVDARRQAGQHLPSQARMADLVGEDLRQYAAQRRFRDQPAVVLQERDRHRLVQARHREHVSQQRLQRVDVFVARNLVELGQRRARLAAQRLDDGGAQPRVPKLVDDRFGGGRLKAASTPARIICGRRPANTRDDTCSSTMRAVHSVIAACLDSSSSPPRRRARSAGAPLLSGSSTGVTTAPHRAAHPGAARAAPAAPSSTGRAEQQGGRQRPEPQTRAGDQRGMYGRAGRSQGGANATDV